MMAQVARVVNACLFGVPERVPGLTWLQTVEAFAMQDRMERTQRYPWATPDSLAYQANEVRWAWHALLAAVADRVSG